MDFRKLKTQQDYSAISSLYTTDFEKERRHYDYIDKALSQIKQTNLEKYPILDMGASGQSLIIY